MKIGGVEFFFNAAFLFAEMQFRLHRIEREQGKQKT
jgi:hypothetical protein